MQDLIIIGAGPAGLTAAIYGARAGLKTLILGGSMMGGQAALKNRIENYPGFPQGVGGPELMQKFLEQAKNYGAIYRGEKVKKLYAAEGENRVETDQGTYQARAIIIATGSKPAKLGIPGEERLTEKGVSYCATSDGSLFKDKKVVLVGDDDVAISEALLLAQYASQVVLIHRRERICVASYLEKSALAEPKISFVFNGVLTSIEGDTEVTGVQIQDVKTKKITLERTDGLFISVGQVPNTYFLSKDIPLSKKGYVLTNAWMATELPGIFAVGDVRNKAFRQISTAVGDGTEGAMAAQHYITNL